MAENVDSIVLDVLRSIQTSVASIDKRMERVEVSVSGLETRMGSLETRMGSLETRMGGLETRMGGLETRIGGLETRMAGLEMVVRKQRRDNAGMLVMMKATAGDFDERVTMMEERMDTLEARGA